MKDFKLEIIKHLEKYVGTKISLKKTIKPAGASTSFDLVFFRANNGRPYHIVSTVGLSDFKMTGKSKNIEIILYLDKDWNLFTDKEEYSWVYRMIQEVSSGFYFGQRPYEYGQIYLTEGSNTFSSYTEMNSAIFFYPIGIDNDSWSLKLGLGKKIDFYLLTTATYREYSILKKMGGLSFVKNYLLDDGDLENLVIYNKRTDK